MTTNNLEIPVWGAAAIGGALGITPRQAQFLLRQGLIPAKKIGRKYVASPAELRQLVSARRKPRKPIRGGLSAQM